MPKEISPDAALCPVNCRYCAVSKVSIRRSLWNERTLLGLNKAVTFVNPNPLKEGGLQNELHDFEFSLLQSDVVCFNAISDPFWARWQEEFRFFLEAVRPYARLITCVTKLPPSAEQWELIGGTPNFRLVVTVTGLNEIERVTTARRVRIIEKALACGVRVFPLIHPYIAGMSNLSFLSDLASLGIKYVDVKGLRYSDETMSSWINPASRSYYLNSQESEVLVEDGWRTQLDRAGLALMPLKEWYRIDMPAPSVNETQAEELVDRLVPMCNICSSDTVEAVRKSAIARRYKVY